VVHGLPDGAYRAEHRLAGEMVRWFDRWLRHPGGADTEPRWLGSRRRRQAIRGGSVRSGDPLAACDPASHVSRSAKAGSTAAAVRPASLDRHLRASPDGRHDNGSLARGHPRTSRGGLRPGRTGPNTGAAAEPLDILNRPSRSTRTSARPSHLVVRLADVAPDGSVEQVSEGILNLTHRDSHAEPSPLEPGRRYEVRVPLRAAGYRFPPGHRISLYREQHWPVIWPALSQRIAIHRAGRAVPRRARCLPAKPPAARPEAPTAPGWAPRNPGGRGAPSAIDQDGRDRTRGFDEHPSDGESSLPGEC
jgi:hypothetical protein